MTPTQWLLLAILLIPLGLMMTNRLRMDLAAVLMAALLALFQWLGWGLLGPAGMPDAVVKAFNGFSEPVIITLFSLFVMINSLEASGATQWLANKIVALGGQSERMVMLELAAATALLSLIMNNLAAAALVLPVAIKLSQRLSINPGKLLIPVSYGSLLGGMATYFTTANMIAGDLLRLTVPGSEPLGILAFTPTGGLIAIAGLIFQYLFGNKLLPDRPTMPSQISKVTSGLDLEDYYGLGDRTWRATVLPESPLVGSRVDELKFGEELGISLAAIRTGHRPYIVPTPATTLFAGDTMLLVGRAERVQQVAAKGLALSLEEHPAEYLYQRGLELAEVLIAPRSEAIGKTLKTLDFRRKTGMSVLVLRRTNVIYRTDVGDIKLEAGDIMLMVGTPQTMSTLINNPDFITLQVTKPESELDQSRALISAGVLLAAIIASLVGLPIHLAMLAGALIMMLSGMVSLKDTYRKMEWQVLFLIAGMYAVSLAMVQTGLADLAGAKFIGLVEPLGSLGLAGGAFLLSAILAQIMGGQVTMLVTGPVLLTAAVNMGVNPQAVAVAAAIGCSAAFLTPMAHPANLVVMVPGNYRFSDFVKAGLPMLLISFVFLLLGMVWFWYM